MMSPTPEAYTWLFGAMGTLHRVLARLELPVPRPVYATYGPPSTLRRWLPVAGAAVRSDPDASAIAQLLRDLVRRLRTQWVPATALPVHLVHGDIRLSNVRRSPTGETVFLDFGFPAHRPRVHDLAYAVAWMVPALDGHRMPERFAWERVPRLITEYETAAAATLTEAERTALVPYTAAVPPPCRSSKRPLPGSGTTPQRRSETTCDGPSCASASGSWPILRRCSASR